MRHLGGGGRTRGKARTMKSIAEIQREYAGLWVAVKAGRVVDVRQTPHALVLALNERHITGATVFRCPGSEEPQLVGMG